MLARLAPVKHFLAVSSADTSADAYLLSVIGQLTGVIRAVTHRWLGTLPYSVSADGTVVAYAHGLDDGDTIRAAGTDDGAMDGEFTVELIDGDTFKVTQVGGGAYAGGAKVFTTGAVTRLVEREMSQSGGPHVFLPGEFLPVAEFVSLTLNGTELVIDEDYRISRPHSKWFGGLGRLCNGDRSLWGQGLARIGGTIQGTKRFDDHSLVAKWWCGLGVGAGGVSAGAEAVIGLAVNRAAQEVYATRGQAQGVQTESYEGYSYSKFQQQTSSGGAGEGAATGGDTLRTLIKASLAGTGLIYNRV